MREEREPRVLCWVPLEWVYGVPVGVEYLKRYVAEKEQAVWSKDLRYLQDEIGEILYPYRAMYLNLALTLTLKDSCAHPSPEVGRGPYQSRHRNAASLG